ncbi:sugar phosphate isomerase/epimerase family protein [Rathayibacter soli]|uniref:sugar phosphate isomerase/epimerase family protein n=1 Tax=Rathayibacter soli TaxID=3144168 RepID=UPI0027E55B77|nr:sugar phosphate isomerase/epimerase [Glaciibacter superstes]
MSSSKLSVQLYTVREALQEDLPGTLARLAEVGFTQVEPFAFTNFPGLGDGLTAAGLSAPTTHVHLLGDGVNHAAVFEAARSLGIQTVIEPYVTPEFWQNAQDVAKTAASLNAAAKIAAGYGIRVGYHNHNHELESIIDGRPALEVFADQLDDAVVLEVDTYWVVVGGQDPVALLKRLGDRVVALHIKDGPGTKDNLDQVAVGNGSMPVRSIIEAAPDALRVIELDDSRGDRFQAVADSFAYLVKENLA